VELGIPLAHHSYLRWCKLIIYKRKAKDAGDFHSEISALIGDKLAGVNASDDKLETVILSSELTAKEKTLLEYKYQIILEKAAEEAI